MKIIVLFSALKNVVIDELMPDNLTRYARESLDQIKLRYPDAEAMDVETAVLKMESKLKSAPFEITEEQYYDGLSQLPPKNFINGEEATTFMMIEHLSGMITGIYASIKGKFFCFNDLCTLKHAEIVEKIKLSQPHLFA